METRSAAVLFAAATAGAAGRAFTAAAAGRAFTAGATGRAFTAGAAGRAFFCLRLLCLFATDSLLGRGAGGTAAADLHGGGVLGDGQRRCVGVGVGRDDGDGLGEAVGGDRLDAQVQQQVVEPEVLTGVL